MSKAPDLRQNFWPPKEIIEAGKNGELVLFVGAGASMLLGLPSWAGLASKVLENLRENEWINFSQKNQLLNLSPKKQLSIADLILKENGREMDLGKYLSGKTEGDSIYKAINDIGCPCVTTNYDELIAPRFTETKDGSGTASPVVRIAEREKFFTKHLSEPGTVVHLHGVVSKPETIIATTKDYLEHYDDENVQEFLSELFQKKTVLFIGYGLEEEEILEHILRRGSAKSTSDRKRFALQGFFMSEQPLYENLHNYYEKSFGVHLLGFVRDHEDYSQQEDLLKSWANIIDVRKPPLVDEINYLNEVLNAG